jgi:LPXTG-motif cell wall-anchored protein
MTSRLPGSRYSLKAWAFISIHMLSCRILERMKLIGGTSGLPAMAVSGLAVLVAGAVLIRKRKRRMNLSLPMLTFDTGPHNRLMEDGAKSARVFAAIKSRYFFRLSGLSYEELMATLDADKRRAFWEDCRKLKCGPWDCLNPHYEILRLLIVAHAHAPADFRWLAVDVRSPELNGEISIGQFIGDDELAKQQWQEQKASLNAWKNMWSGFRSKLDSAFVAEGKPRPKTFKQAYNEYGPRLLPSIGKLLYDGGLKADAKLREEVIEPDTDMETVKHFIDNCPPFRALLCASLMSWYHHSARDEDGERFRAGRNDLFMALYLPYCDKFVTSEKYAEQERCLRKIASVLGLRTEILSYDAFIRRL